ncbi:MAG: hypothetical protein Q7T55_24720 [Solirubrobacteraceae bacterium]|nr:hypothetical protein [Solirubrobacteraceae bacterium]
MDISAIGGGVGGYPVSPARFESAAIKTPGVGRPDTDYAVPTPGERVDGTVSGAAPTREVAMNLDLLDKSMDAQRYVIDLLA